MKRTKRVTALLVGVAMLISQLTMPGIGKRALAANSFQDLNQSQITEAMGAGWNLGNQLEASNGGTPSETAYGNPVVSESLIKAVKNAGFRSIRIPVSYLSKIGSEPDYTIDSSWLDRVQQVVDMCVDNDLYAIINMHGDGYTTVDGGWLYCGSGDSEQEQIKAKYKACWKQIAMRFQSYDEHLIFESMNEEFDGTYGNPLAKAYANINAYNQIFVDTVRQTGGNNDKRWLLIPGWNTNINYTADNYGFQLPTDSYRSGDIATDEQRIMISVHYYDPWDFCGKEDGSVTQWGDAVTDSSKKASWGDESYLKSQFQKLQRVFVQKGYPVVIGEYGSIDKSNHDSGNAASRIEFARKVCSYAKTDGLIPVYWDNGYNGQYGFGLFDRYNSQVTQQGIIDAIMDVYGSETTTSTPKTTTAAPSGSPAGATDVPSMGVENKTLFENGGVGESYETNDASWLSNGKDSEKLTVIYTCTEADHAGWRILGWGASVDGAWKEGKGYSAGSPASAQITDTCTLKELREALDIKGASTVSYLKLSAYNGGKILKIYLEKEASVTSTPTPVPTTSATAGESTQSPKPGATAEVLTQSPEPSATVGAATQPPKPNTTEGAVTQPPKPDTTEGAATQPPKPNTTEGAVTQSPKPDTTVGAATQPPKPNTTEGAATQSPKLDTTEGAATQSPEPSATAGAATQPPKPDTTAGAVTQSPKPDATEGAATQPPKPDTTAGAVTQSSKPHATEGAVTQPPKAGGQMELPKNTRTPDASVTPAPEISEMPVQWEHSKKMYATKKYSFTAGKNIVVNSYHSSNLKVARVDSSGIVSALQAGTAVITATCGDGTLMVLKLQVIKPKVKLKKNKITIRKGEKARIKIKKKLSSDQVKKYRVDHKKVVRVTGNGKITGRKKGRTYVTVIMKSGVRKRCRIIVR